MITSLLLAFIAVGDLPGPSAHPKAIACESIMPDPNLTKLEQTIIESDRQANLHPDNKAWMSEPIVYARLESRIALFTFLVF